MRGSVIILAAVALGCGGARDYVPPPATPIPPPPPAEAKQPSAPCPQPAESRPVAKPAAAGPVWTEPAYLGAITDSFSSPPWTALTPLLTKAPLKYRGQGKDAEFLVVTWTDKPDKGGFEPKAVKNFWVTAAPMLQTFCKSIPEGASVPRRLEQVLGLPSNRGYTHFVEFWVRGSDVIRPCADSETGDAVCDGKGKGSDVYRESIAGRDKCKNGGEWCFPFTGRGYTFDWGDNPSHVGLSEFVVPKEKVGRFERAVKTEEYCTR
jgi:hypothetical protein